MEFPKIHKVVISEFSLYKLKSEIVLDINDGVFCLAGANGLGKSTFISIISYALTGVVVDPQRDFGKSNQIPTFFKNNEKFAESYFSGRINESSRESSYVGIEFSIKNFLYKIKRNFFDTSGLIEFSRIDQDTKNETINQSLTSAEFLSWYKDKFKEDVGLALFEQYAFIQSFVLTFDESKKLIFWDPDAMNRVLYLFFGIDSYQANLADDLRKKFAAHDSLVRNAQWSITLNERQLIELSAKLPEKEALEEGKNAHADILAKEDELEKLKETFEKKQSEYKNCELNISNISLNISNMNRQYETIFNDMQNGNVPIEQDKNVISLLRHISSKILIGENVDLEFENLKKQIISVSNSYKEQNLNDSIKELSKIDIKISEFQKELNELLLEKERLQKEMLGIEKNKNNLFENIDKFKLKNEKIIKEFLLSQKSDINADVESIKKTIERETAKKIKETRLRDECKEELKKIEKEIRKSYQNTENDFLPIFKKYANSFIGLDIDIELKSSSKGIGLCLKINNIERKDGYQLSESQKYFIDIALRFALIEISKSNQAAIFIDTPEGSLDIAYESRAGKMFGDFVQKGFDVIMTANINSSQLLLQLAKKCKKGKMKVERMTSWTELSAVQQEEQGIIEKAFEDIEGALNANA